jgi:exodeoxyribonuclease V alpha subunit
LPDIVQGFEDLAKDPQLAVLEESFSPQRGVAHWEGSFYFWRNWCDEGRCLDALRRLLHGQPSIEIDRDAWDKCVSDLQEQGGLLPEQAAAIQVAARGRLTLISGGPGTGKTYTAGHLIRLLAGALQGQRVRPLELALAAPTGKAAAQLQSSLESALGQDSVDLKVQARTLHALLEVGRADVPALTADIVLVDESSMIDIRLMARLLEALRPGSRLILLGDRDQLPSVEAGAVFADLHSSQSPAIVRTRAALKTCLRAELKTLIDFAAEVNAGRPALAQRLMAGDYAPSIAWRTIPATGQGGTLRTDLLHLMEHWMGSPGQTAEEAFECFQRFRILTPLRQGRYGVDRLNTFFWDWARGRKRTGPLFAPVMLSKNDQRLAVFNGECGVLVHHWGAREEDYVLLKQSDGKGYRKLPALLLPHLEFAYAMSVHKSQGSEFAHVALLLPQGSESFGREVLYTAITRARQGLEIWSQPGIFEATLARRCLRRSGLLERFAAQEHSLEK